jgi:ABC-type sugar transport system ATPase subunit
MHQQTVEQAMHAGVSTTAVAVTKLTKRFPGVIALNEVSFDVRMGEVHAVVGENGAGKSTLIKAITGVEQPDAGHIEIFGRSVDGQNATARRAEGVTAIYQELTTVPAMSATANVFLDQPLHKAFFLRRRPMRRAFVDLSSRLGVTIDPDQRGGMLSISDQQMIEIMRALIARHRILIMDEPTAALGPTERVKLFEVIAELRRQGTAIIYISHDLDEVIRISDRISVMRNGSFVATDAKSAWTKDRMVRSMLGQTQSRSQRSREPGYDEPILVADRLTVPGRFRDLSFSVRHGEIFGVAGLVGSGRTELLRAVAGAQPDASGRIMIDGAFRSLPRKITEGLHLGIAYVPEDRKAHGLVPLLSGTRNVVLTDLRRVATAGIVQPQKCRELAEAATGPLGFDRRRLEVPVRTLSGGNQQKLVVGKWLHRKSKILLLDEPTRGIDVGAKAELYAAIRRLADEGLSVVLVSSELEEVVQQADRIAVLARGGLVATLEHRDASVERILELIFSVEGQG